MFLRGQVAVDGGLPVVGGGFVGGGEGGDVVVAFACEGSASVYDLHLCGCWFDGIEANFDSCNHDGGDEVGVNEVVRLEIEERVDPYGSDGAVLDCENGALLVMCVLRIEELRVPVLAGPGTFAFGTEEWRGFSVGKMDNDVECGLRVVQLRCGRGLTEGRCADDGCCSEGEGPIHRLRSLR